MPSVDLGRQELRLRYMYMERTERRCPRAGRGSGQQGRGTYALTLHHRYDTIAALINKDMASPTLMTA